MPALRAPRTTRRPKAPPPPAFQGYLVLFKDQQWRCYARTALEAKQLGVVHFKVRKSWVQFVNAVPASKGWNPVTHEPELDGVDSIPEEVMQL